MKRHPFLLLLLLLAGLAPASAQVENTMRHQGFLSARAGVPLFQHGTSGFGGGLSIGEWILKPLAFQVSADFDMVSDHPSGNSVNYLYGSAEFVWDPMATFGFRNQGIGNVHDRLKSKFNLYGLIGLGAVTRGGEDSVKSSGLFYDGDFYGMLGAQVSYFVGRRTMIDLAGRFLFFSNGFDGESMQGGKRAVRLTVGLTHNFFDEPYHRRPSRGSRHPQEDWFMGLGVGINYSSFEFDHFFDSGMMGLLGFAPEVMIGKNYSNVWTVRFELSGLRAREHYMDGAGAAGRAYSFSYLHSDFMVNLCNLSGFARGRRLGVLPYLGAGPIWRYEHPTITFAADAGCMFRYYLDLVGDFYVDLKYTMMAPRISGGIGQSESVFGVGLLTATVGYIYNFKYNTTRYNPPVNKVRNIH